MTITLRPATPADAPAIAAVQVAGWHATYPGMVPPQMLAAMTQANREMIWVRMLLALEDKPSGVMLLAERAGAVIGFLRAGPQRLERHAPTYPSEIYALYVHPEAQRCGAGRALFRAATQALCAQGSNAATLWVMTQNIKARRFYEALGGTCLEAQTAPVDGGSFDEVAYGWRDLSSLG